VHLCSRNLSFIHPGKMTVRDLTFTRDSLLAYFFKILLKAFVSYGGIVDIAENSGAQF
jgi:hypothetical protein